MKRMISAAVALLLCTALFAAKHYNYFKNGPWVTNIGETEFTVLWTTEKPVLTYVTICEVGGEAFEAAERPKFYQTVAGRATTGTFHSVKVSGLKPGTRYEYRIYGKEVVDNSSAYATTYGPEQRYRLKDKQATTVKTLDSKAAGCRFSMVCDMHFSAGKYSSLFAEKKGEDLDFIALCGDITSYSQDIDTVIKYSFKPIENVTKDAPIVFARGNHESRGKDFAKVPSLFPTKTGKFYYSFRQGPVAFLVLDAGEDKPDSAPEYSGHSRFDEYRAEELEWLKKAVKEESFSSAPKKVVLMHIPTLNIKNAWYTQKWITRNFAPVLSEAGIDLMLSGHHHKLIIKKKGEDGIAYPILVNSNNDRLDFSADAGKITINIVSKDGTLVKTLEY